MIHIYHSLGPVPRNERHEENPYEDGTLERSENEMRNYIRQITDIMGESPADTWFSWGEAELDVKFWYEQDNDDHLKYLDMLTRHPMLNWRVEPVGTIFLSGDGTYPLVVDDWDPNMNLYTLRAYKWGWHSPDTYDDHLTPRQLMWLRHRTLGQLPAKWGRPDLFPAVYRRVRRQNEHVHLRTCQRDGGLWSVEIYRTNAPVDEFETVFMFDGFKLESTRTKNLPFQTGDAVDSPTMPRHVMVYILEKLLERIK